MGDAILGENYLTGLLWALEILAWDEKFLVRVCVILAELALHDTGKGNWGNRPANSLTTILLPWFPQTIAAIGKRKVALQTLQKETPRVAWKLLLSMLPNQHQASSGTAKPSWRPIIPDTWKDGVKLEEYWEQIYFSADLAVTMASGDINKLSELVGHLDILPQPSFDRTLEFLSSEGMSNKSEDERLRLWNSLMDFVAKHKRFPDLSRDIVSKIENVANKLAPTNPLNLHRRLFSNRDFDLYEENGEWEEQRKKLEDRRKAAINEILTYGGMDAIIQFAEVVDSPLHVGLALGAIAQTEIDTTLLPMFLQTENKKHAQFVNGYILSRQYTRGWVWVDDLSKSTWSVFHIGQFLSYLPFMEETWTRSASWLGNSEQEYWIRASVNPYQSQGDLRIAIDNLIKFGRPNAAIDCLYKTHMGKQPIDRQYTVKALLAALSSDEPSHAMDTYHVVEIIKALQSDPETNPDDLFQVEWAYLPILDGSEGAYPKLLGNRLASDLIFSAKSSKLFTDQKRKQSLKEK